MNWSSNLTAIQRSILNELFISNISLYAVWCPSSLLQIKSHREEKVETSRASCDEDKDTEQEQRIVGGQPFIQAPQRESVIFFSTGKTLLRAPRFEKQESSAHHEQHGPVSSEQRKMLPVREGTSSVSEPSCQINPSVQSLHRGNTDISRSACSVTHIHIYEHVPEL